MKKSSILLLCFCAVNLAAFSQATPASMQHSSGETHIMMNSDQLKWVDAPPGLPAGAKIAVLAGNPGEKGPFTLRAKFPANYKVPPHWHPTTENVVVLQGTLYMGSGEKLDESSATALTVGGFSSIPAKAAHYAFTKEDTEIQVYAEGPFEITYINPADDPRKATMK